MIAFRGMLVGAAEKAGIKIPADPDKYDKDEYTHWHVFCLVQLGRPTRYHGEHWDNAKVIAEIPDDEIAKVMLEDLIGRGLVFCS